VLWTRPIDARCAAPLTRTGAIPTIQPAFNAPETRMSSTATTTLLAAALLASTACSREEPKPPAAPPTTQVAERSEGKPPAPAAPLEGKKSVVPTQSGVPDPNLPGFVRPVSAVAVVNQVEIPASKFNEEFDRLVGRGAKVPQDRIKRIGQNILGKLVEAELRRQAIEREHITLTEAEFDAGYKEYLQRWVSTDGKFNEEQFNAFLRHGNLTVETLKAQIREQRIQRKLVERLGKLEVTDAETREFYEQNAQTWLERESCDVRPLLLRVPENAPKEEIDRARAKAASAREELVKGGDFEEISKRYSDGPMAPIHITRGSPEKELEEQAFTMRVGQVSQPIKTRWGIYVIRLLERRPERKKGYDEVREDIRRTLSARKFYLEDRRIVDELRRTATIEERLPQ